MNSVEKQDNGVANPAGALRALRFGSQSVWEMAELVNWANRSDYQAKVVKPWVELEETGSSPASKEVKIAAMASDASARQRSQEPTDEVSPSEVLEPSVELPIASVNELVAESPAENISEPELHVEHEVDSEPEVSEVVAKQELESESVDNNIQAETAHVAVDEGRAGDMSESVDHEQAPEHDLNSSSDREQSDDHPPIKEVVKPERAETTKQSEKPARIDKPKSGSAGIKLGTKTMALPTATRPIQANAVGDDYLHRLESLVLELNWQLAQQTSETPASDEDYVQWLSRRVVALSVENMQLHEELRNAKG